jgi:hypothetical protein
MKKMIGAFVQNHLFLNMKVGNVISTRILFLTIFKFLNLFNPCKVMSQSHVVTSALTVGEVVSLFNVRQFNFTQILKQTLQAI